MERVIDRRSTLLAAAAICFAAGAMPLLPRLEAPLRAAVLDVVVSGQVFVLDRYHGWRAASASAALMPISAPGTSNTAPLEERSRELEQTCRRLRIENAKLREELRLAEKYGVSPFPVATAPPAGPQAVVQAALIGPQALEEWSFARQLSGGRARGIADASLVLEENSSHLDAGSDAGIEPELDVFVGRCVVGRIASVGRWTSTLEPITDPRYRALAQIVRPTDQGGSFGTEGILVGAGNELCKLTEVPTTQTVRVGDEIYTSDRDRRTIVPLYYGRIVRVKEMDRHWDITVEPAVNPGQIKRVAVVKLPPSSGRVLAE